jgi:predicted RNase H-like HicB family nuclease
VVTCAPTLNEARDMLVDAAQEMVASYREEGREPPIGGGRVESLKITLAA